MLLDTNKASLGEDIEMAGGGRPGAVETGRELAGGQRAPAHSQDGQDLATITMSERAEDSVDTVKFSQPPRSIRHG
jgi:hypothetical protein